MSFTKAELIEFIRAQKDVSPAWADVADWSDEDITSKLVGVKSKARALEAFKPVIAEVEAELEANRKEEQKAERQAAREEAKADEPKAARKARDLEDRVIVEPAGVARDAKPGTKRFLLVEALKEGATVEEMTQSLNWTRDSVLSALRTDIKALGLGVERKAGKYFLLKGRKA